MSPHLPKKPICLFLDVDGTLIDIAPKPDEVVVPADLIRTLGTLADRLGGALALVSGRMIADLDRLFAPLRLRASGVHGGEMRFDPGGEVTRDASPRLPEAIIDALRMLSAQHPGTLLEDKVFSTALHYRAVPQSGEAIGRRLAALVRETAPDDLRILPGHMVFEVKGAGFDKGAAIARFLATSPFQGRTPVFVGDDVTDEPGFAAVAERGGLAFAVGRERGAAPAVFAAPENVRTWLHELARDPTGPT